MGGLQRGPGQTTMFVSGFFLPRGLFNFFLRSQSPSAGKLQLSGGVFGGKFKDLRTVSVTPCPNV